MELKASEIAERPDWTPSYLKRYPHAFSGGQRQRIGIARALIIHPRVIVCDEPVSALDVSIQAQVINLLKDLQKEMGLTYIFISHDLSVVEHISDKVGVMYLGKMVEFAETVSLFSKPLHPYTEALLSSVPVLQIPPLRWTELPLKGEIPNPANPPSGCYFHERCSYCIDKCTKVSPEYREIEKNRFVACHRAEELKLRGFLMMKKSNLKINYFHRQWWHNNWWINWNPNEDGIVIHAETIEGAAEALRSLWSRLYHCAGGRWGGPVLWKCL